ncbi:hypothetical protein [uncultured Methanobrevibacter sp.]|uniref:hypothetical protein n=1 Tax=uncultured Methanobrevibacter sp. TaxID=253161 RepID=UPI0025D2D12D|nr:hypothetical protein [uncultured Methanobrevibacter sp.]
MSDELYISFLFPPSDYVSGISVSKRIIENQKKVDVLQADFKSNNQELSQLLDEFIDKRIIVDMDCEVDWSECIFKFVNNSIDLIDNDYKKIYSRSWLMANHFLAIEYKISHPDVYWTCEFSDPLMYDLSNNVKNYKEMIIDNEAYIDKINQKILSYNKTYNANFPQVENNNSAYFIAEYLSYIFADKIIFTNENQRQIMLDQFPLDIKNFILNKSEVKAHPTLDFKYYNIKKADLNLDKKSINIAYFGNEYYSKRNFENLFYALESLNHQYKSKIQVYIFINDDKFLKRLTSTLNFKNIHILKPLDYLEFLNATTEFDVLLINDMCTQGAYDVNPYLPSKLSDYLGSQTDIWAFYEKNSTLSKANVKYKSDIQDFKSSSIQLAKILKDYGFDDNYTIEDCMYLRISSLNELLEKEYKKRLKLQKKLKSKRNLNIKNPFKK